MRFCVMLKSWMDLLPLDKNNKSAYNSNMVTYVAVGSCGDGADFESSNLYAGCDRSAALEKAFEYDVPRPDFAVAVIETWKDGELVFVEEVFFKEW